MSSCDCCSWLSVIRRALESTHTPGWAQFILGQLESMEKTMRERDPSQAALLQQIAQCLVDPFAPLGPIGHVDEVNGHGAELVPAYVPTRHELRQMVREWYKTALDIRLSRFLYDISGSVEIRLEPYANKRLNQLEEVLGRNEVERIVESVNADAERRTGKERWRIFTSGTPQEWAQVRQEIREGISKQDLKCKDKDAPAAEATIPNVDALPPF